MSKRNLIQRGLTWSMERFPYVYSVIPDKHYLSMKYWAIFGKKINWHNPQTFNEKIQWLKLYDRKKQYSMMVDKYEAKKFIADRIGNKYVIPTIGIYNSFNDIDFDSLPDKFVMKCTHNSGGLVVCRNKSSLDVEDSRKKIEKSLILFLQTI